MNLLTKSFSWAASAALLFTFSSCKEIKKIGSEIQPQNNQFAVSLVDTFSVDLSTVYYKDINTRVANYTLFGNYNDPELGTFGVTGYTMLDNVRDNLSFEQGAIFDSLVLHFVGFPYYYGDTTQNFELEVYRLEQALDTSVRYNAGSVLAKGASPIGVANFKPFTHRRDTLKVRLNADLGFEMLQKGGQPELANHFSFNQYLRGFAFSSKSDKCVLGFRNDNIVGLTDRAFVRLYYSVIENGVRRRRFQSFNFSTRNLCFNSINVGFNGVLSQLSSNKDTLTVENASNRTFVQNSSALYTVIKFNNLETLKSLKNSILINRAEISIKVDSNNFFSNGVRHNPPALTAYFANEQNDFKRNADSSFKALTIRAAESRLLTVSGYNRTRQSYTLDATEFVQDLIYGREENSKLLLTPSNFASTLDRLIITQPKENIRLRVFYTRF